MTRTPPPTDGSDADPHCPYPPDEQAPDGGTLTRARFTLDDYTAVLDDATLTEAERLRLLVHGLVRDLHGLTPAARSAVCAAAPRHCHDPRHDALIAALVEHSLQIHRDADVGSIECGTHSGPREKAQVRQCVRQAAGALMKAKAGRITHSMASGTITPHGGGCGHGARTPGDVPSMR